MPKIEKDSSERYADWLLYHQDVPPAQSPAVTVKSIVDELYDETVFIATPRYSLGLVDLLSSLPPSRVYLLTSDESMIDSIKGPLRMIRILDEPQSGAILITGSRASDDFDAWIFPDADMRFGYRVPTEQTKSKYLAFASLFWNHTTKEYCGILDASVPVNPQTNGDFSNADPYCLRGIGALLEYSPCSDAYLARSEDYAPGYMERCKSLTFSESGLPSSALPDIDGDLFISSSDNHGFSFLMTDTCGIVLPNVFRMDGITWSCKLSDDMSQKFIGGYSRDWSPGDGVMLRELVGLRVRSKAAPKVEKTVEMTGKARASVQCNTMAELKNEIIPDDPDKIHYENPFSCMTEYEVIFLAPLLPQGAVKDTRYQEWEEKQEEWRINIEKIRSRLGSKMSELESKLGGIEKANIQQGYKTRCSFLDELLKDSENLPKLTEKERKDLYDRYKKLSKDASYFFRQTNQYDKDAELRKKKSEAIRDKTNSGLKTASRGFSHLNRVLIDRTQDLFSPIVDGHDVKTIKFPKPLPRFGTLYKYGDKKYLALPSDSPGSAFLSETVEKEAKQQNAELCRERQ